MNTYILMTIEMLFIKTSVVKTSAALENELRATLSTILAICEAPRQQNGIKFITGQRLELKLLTE
jgi:hypothetical protein